MKSSTANEIRSNRKSVVLGTLAGWLMALWSKTLRVELRDESGLGDDDEPMPPVILAMWHSRIFAVPPVWKTLCGGRRRCVVLTSASHDGDMVANAMAVFGLEAVRGSSSRRGVAALIGLKKALREGCDVSITPDGPRGPRYHVQAGVVKLAESTGAPVVPLHASFGSAWRLKSWDRFVIPKPFSRLVVTFGPAMHFERGMDADELEQARQNLELVLVAGADDA